jgi:hypothetical protein
MREWQHDGLGTGEERQAICRNPKSSYLTRAIGCRLHGNWEIQDDSLVNCDVRAWLKLPSTQGLRCGAMMPPIGV